MTALPLAALETHPIRIPVYRNERIRKFALWFADNDAAIAEYFNALKPYCEEGCEPLVDYWTFAVIQHEREELKLLQSDAGTPSGAVLTCRLPSGPAGSFLEQVLGSVEVLDDVCLHGRKHCEECAHKFGPQWLDPQDERLPHGGGVL